MTNYTVATNWTTWHVHMDTKKINLSFYLAFFCSTDCWTGSVRMIVRRSENLSVSVRLPTNVDSLCEFRSSNKRLSREKLFVIQLLPKLTQLVSPYLKVKSWLGLARVGLIFAKLEFFRTFSLNCAICTMKNTYTKLQGH